MPKEYSRTQRVADLLQREMAKLLQQEVRDPRLGLITLTRVQVASDLSFAKIYITQVEDKQPIEQTIKQLNKMSGFFRYRLAPLLQLRIVPQLKFFHDVTLNQGNKLASLIDEALAADERKHNKE